LSGYPPADSYTRSRFPGTWSTTDSVFEFAPEG
jgi:hypothetical protein